MPDWKRLVRERIVSLKLPPGAQEEVIAELAAHLEEIYENARSRGMSDGLSLKVATQEVEDWPVLAAGISRAKSKEDPMNERIKALWLPGMATLLGASLFLSLLQLSGFQPRLVWFGHMAMSFYWPWLAGLPLFGAMGAYLSRRAQGPIRARLAAGLSPALVMLITMCLILPWGLAIDGFSFFRLVYFGVGLTNWVALPAVALLLGTVPFLHESPVPQTRSTT